jgi:ribosomal protein L7/L12
MRPSFTPLLRDRLASGASFEDGLRTLREAGASPIDTIKAIREVKKTDLGVAKQLFSESPAWKDVVDATQVLHEELITAAEAEQKKWPIQQSETTRGK